MTAARMAEEMPADEFHDWILLYASRPWGYDIDNLRMGILAAEIHNTSGHVKRSARPRDYFPRLRVRDTGPKDKAYWDGTKDAWRAFVKRQNDVTKHPRNRRSRPQG